MLESDILDKAYFYTKEEIEIRNQQCYTEYLEKIENYISEWTEEECTDLANELKKSHVYSKEKLASENPEKRKFHFMDTENVEKSRQYEVNIYEYFFMIISTLENSNKIIVMNFGKD